MEELLIGLSEYFTFYNGERPHQSLSNQTPDQVYESAQGGGAMIVDKFSDENLVPKMMAESGQRCSAACEVDSAT